MADPEHIGTHVEKRLQELDISLPVAAAPLGAYTPAVRAGSLVFVSGTLPVSAGQLAFKGKLGAELSVEQGQAAARQAVLNALGSLKAEIGSLDRVKRILRVEGHIASSEGFTDQAAVMNGASEVLVDIFGDRGRHTRLAVGAHELPLGAPVEIALIAEIDAG